MALAEQRLCLPNIFRMIGHMKKPGECEDWPRFGALVKARRSELGLSQIEVQDRGGPSDVIQSRIENNDTGAPRPRGSTIRKLDAPLEWEDGSAMVALKGGQPTPRGTGGSIRYIADEELIAEITRRLKEAHDVLETTQKTRAPRETSQDEEAELASRPRDPAKPATSAEVRSRAAEFRSKFPKPSNAAKRREDDPGLSE